MSEKTQHRKKSVYIGAPACFALEMACKQVQAAFAPTAEGSFGQCFVVGSALERPDWRDVDVRMILDDDSFDALFPMRERNRYEFDQRWTLMTVAVSRWMQQQTGLPIDFQFQPMTHANQTHNGPRHAAGMEW
jgi:hypothetical protein